MKINEIELIGDQDFSIDKVNQFLIRSTPYGGTIHSLNINYFEHGNSRVIILTDDDKNIAAFAGFYIWNNGKVWRARNCQSYSPFKGQALVGKIYKFVKETLHKSIQSESEQSYGGKKLWTKILPGLGLKPMIFDTSTEQIIDPMQHTDIDVYAAYDEGNSMHWRYTWILEKNDHYPEQNLLNEGTLLIPYTGLWYTPTEKDINDRMDN